MLGSCLLFAVRGTCVGLAHAREPALSTLVMSAMRAGVNLLALVVLVRGDLRRLVGDGRAALWTRGAVGGAALLQFLNNQAPHSVGAASFLNQTSAIWVAILAPFVLGERTGRWVWAAVAGSMIGIAFLGHPRGDDGDLLGRAAGLASGLTSAGAYVSVRRASRTNGPVVIVFYFTLIATVVSVLLTFLTGASWSRDPIVYLWLTASGLSATGGQLLITDAYRLGRASRIAASGASGPLLSTLFGWMALDQVPDRPAFVGMAILVVTGILMPLLG